MKLLRKIHAIINKDTTEENESKKMSVLIRMLSLTLVAFFLIATVAFFLRGYPGAGLGNLGLLTLYLLIFLLSYRLPKMATVLSFILVTTLWAISMLWLFGPDSGFQIFPPFLIFIFFFAGNSRFFRKLVFGIVTFALYQAMSLLYGSRAPLLDISISARHCVRDSCMFIIILCTCIAAHIFSRDSQILEHKLIEYNKRLKEKANTDPLTGLNNRGMAMDYLQGFVKRADSMICCICICDIDHFKRVNDTYGHDAGDLVLKAVAKAMKNVCGEKCFLARWGGEEFFIAFPELNGDEAMDVLYRIQKAVKKSSVEVNGETISVTLTYGLTEYDKEKGLDENIKDADNNLYLGKEQGRNRIVF
ncbi:MAG: GGDEF domain-containing protein [Lachnospiraceae bacterium]|nr:GGDEF domain-containing protein [Lachnospiraceae bacterium]